jgi:ribosomal protein L40E
MSACRTIWMITFLKGYMAKFEEAAARLIRGIFVCRSCKSKVRASSLKVSQGKIKCRSCSSAKLRPKRKK